MRSDPPLDDCALSPFIRYPAPSRRPAQPRLALLTGATGFLGANLLSDLLLRTPVKVLCAVRAHDEPAARARVRQALVAQRLWRDEFEGRIRAVPADLSRPALGLSESSFTSLGEETDVLYHCGAALSVLKPYRALRGANVAGTHEMLRLASLGRPKTFHHVSSIAALAPSPDPAQPIEEDFVPPGPPPGRLGYAASKWVAEQLVVAAAERGLPATIYRLGRITGHRRTGVCNPDDALSLVLAGSIRLGVAPAIERMIHLTPVDLVSRAVVDLSRGDDVAGRAIHLINPAAVSWDQVVETLSACGYVDRAVPFDEWRRLVHRRLTDGDRTLERLAVVVARDRAPFSSQRRNVVARHAPLRLGDLDYPSDHRPLLAQYARHLAESCAAGGLTRTGP